MTPADLDALVARLHTAADDRAMTDYGVCNLLTEAAAALAELREENALIGHPPAQIQKLERRAERAEAEVARLKDLVTETCVKELAQMTRAHDAELRIAALEAERDWYKSRADDIVRYLSMKPPQITAVEAVIAELTLRAAKERP